MGPGEFTTTSLPAEDAAPVGQALFAVCEKRLSGGDQRDTSEADCGIYDMPALTVEALPRSSSSSSTSIRRLSVSSNGSGDVQWRASLSGLVHSVLSVASCSASALSARDLATSLAEILSTWKASHSGDPPPPLQQAWARLSDLLPALSAIGNAPPSDGLLTLVQRSLEESVLLLQAQSRPRLPSQDSLSRRPLPALPGPDGKSSGGGMGSRKSSWIQERPLPPTPQPAFPLPPTPVTVTLTVGPGDGEDDPTNEYAGIGLTPVPAPVPTGDSVGYVKLQVSSEFGRDANERTSHCSRRVNVAGTPWVLKGFINPTINTNSPTWGEECDQSSYRRCVSKLFNLILLRKGAAVSSVLVFFWKGVM